MWSLWVRAIESTTIRNGRNGSKQLFRRIPKQMAPVYTLGKLNIGGVLIEALRDFLCLLIAYRNWRS